MASKEKKLSFDAHIAITTFNLLFFTIAILVLSYKVYRLEKAQLMIFGVSDRGEPFGSRQPDVAGKNIKATKNINNGSEGEETIENARRVIGEGRRPNVRRRVKRHDSFHQTMQTVAFVRLCQSTLHGPAKLQNATGATGMSHLCLQGPRGPPGPRGQRGRRGKRGRPGKMGPRGPPCVCATSPLPTVGSKPYSTPSSSVPPGVKTTVQTVDLMNAFRQMVTPKFTLLPRNVVAKEGENVSFVCNATSFPASRVSWLKKEKSNNDSERFVEEEGRLTITTVRFEDNGRYTCRAANIFDSVTSIAELVVYGSPRFLEAPIPSVTKEVFLNVTLPCKAIAYPAPKVTWVRSPNLPLPRGRHVVTNNGITITNLRLEDAGMYICKATNSYGQELGGTMLKVLNDFDCSMLYRHGYTKSGIYTINPGGKGSFSVYCDMATDGGGWTVFQRRQDGSVEFRNTWQLYASGFGSLDGEFWLGNEKIHRLTSTKRMELRVDLYDWNNNKRYAKYSTFQVSDASSKYRLTVTGYSGNANDGLGHHNGMMFTTKDSDNDQDSRHNCARSRNGAWWYNDCNEKSNLNGPWLGDKFNDDANTWNAWLRYRSLKKNEMKMRPASFLKR